MIVHFTASRDSLVKDIKALRLILKTTQKQNHEIANNWIELAHKKVKLNRAPSNTSCIDAYKIIDGVMKNER